MKTVTTITATIYIGRREGYSNKIYDADVAKQWLQNYCDEVGFCITVTETEFIYKNGNEPGLIIGLINYPRFPLHWQDLHDRAVTIAKNLMLLMGQEKVTVVFTGYMNETEMFTRDDIYEEQAA